jgi:signal peptidase II
MKNSPYRFFLLSLFLIIIDQAIKLWMYHNPFNGPNAELVLIGDWFKLHYVLNEGMAFGMKLDFIPGGYGKMALTIFRIFAMFGIGWYLIKLAKTGANTGLLWCIAAILGGAIGNVIDSTFYGVLLGNAPFDAPTPWFHGQVIDMFYIDPWQGFLPEWLPFWGGTYYSNPIFNFADAAIFCGVVVILFNQNSFFKEPVPEQNNDATVEKATENQITEEQSLDETQIEEAQDIATDITQEQARDPNSETKQDA